MKSSDIAPQKTGSAWDLGSPQAVERPTRKAAALYAAALSLLFMGVYGGCNWITSQRTDVGTWYYGFERHIPFVPLMILPYMSIDLFFVSAPFLCQSRAELSALARRISFAIIVAGFCFLLIPLHIAVPCPQTTGWTGAIFAFLHGFDQPYNLFPSLHITLLAILTDIYARHTRGALRAVCVVWFSLIFFSTLLTYQHHLVDVIGGLILAIFCFYCFRQERAKLTVIPNYRVGLYYAMGALVCLGLATSWWRWAGFLLWPAISFGITASGFFGLGPGVFRKHQGRIPWVVCLVLGPTLLGQYLSWRYYRRQCRPWDQIAPQVWIGARLNGAEAHEAARQGVTAVLDLTAEFSETPEFLKLNYRNIPILDLTRLPERELLECVDFITKHATKGVVYVHCKVGYSRSAAAVGAYLLASGRAATVEEALAILRKARPTIVFRPEVMEALERFQNRPRVK